MGTYVWSQWLSSITFGLYTKFREEIEFEGSDLSSGIQRIEYVISDRVYATSAQLEEAIAKGIETYITYQKMEKPIVYKDGKSIVYGKFIDNAGWVTYSSSNGIIQDEIAPVITVKTVGFTEGVVTNKRQTSIQVKVQDNNISNVTYQIGKSEEIIPASKSEFSIPIEEDGEYKVSIHATDMVGNRTIREINVKRDTHAPKAEEVTVDSEYEYEASVIFRASEASTLYYVIDEKGKLSYGSKKLIKVGRTKACKSGENSISFTGLMINTSYKLHYLLEDAAGNLSAPKSTTFTTAKGELKGTLTISGDATYGSLLRARLSNIRTDSGRVKYSWYRQGKEEPLKEGYGNSYAKYRIRSADVGEKIRLVVSTKNCKSTLKETTSSIAAIDSVIQVESDITPNTKKGDMIQLRIKLVNAAEEETPAGTVSVYQKGNELLSGLKFAFVDEEWVAFVRLKATTHYLDWEIRYMTGDEDGLRGSESTQKILIK